VGRLIWTRERGIVDAADVTVSVLDRTFEHGLGLFETFRTWAGAATLAHRHRERMERSARELALGFDSTMWPDSRDIYELITAERINGDARIRVTLSGGLADSRGALCWMSAGVLPEPTALEGAVIGYGMLRVDESDMLSRHKTLNYWPRRLAYERARASGSDERLTVSSDGRVWEGTRMNLFIVRSGSVWTPPLDGPILPGIMRGFAIEQAKGLGIEVHEEELNLATLTRADEVFLTSAVRGVVPVGRLHDRKLDAPGPLTRRLRARMLENLVAAEEEAE
jgi:branched-chain amino acid aminotransferase/4-amino-4-deoxychorismate lyase